MCVESIQTPLPGQTFYAASALRGVEYVARINISKVLETFVWLKAEERDTLKSFQLHKFILPSRLM